MSVEPTSPTRYQSGVPSQALDLVWPPSDRDIDAITVVDLQAPSPGAPRPGQAPGPGQTPGRGQTLRPGQQQSSLIIHEPPHPEPRRRVPGWVLIVGLITVELASYRVGQPRSAEAVAPLVAFPIARAWAPPSGAALRSRLTPVMTRARQSAGEAHRSGTRASIRKSTPTPPRSVTRLAQLAREAAVSGAVDTSQMTERLAAVSSSRPREFVPARILESPRPRHVPSAFPTPRGSRTSLELEIDERGRVAAARVASSGAGYYDAPLLAATRSWRFEPALANGRPTRSLQTIQVTVP